MKITDVSLTLFSWDDIPATQYGLTSRFAGSSALGLLCLRTDDGVEGHAFLGSASNSAANDAQGLISHLKPILMGRDPILREAIVTGVFRPGQRLIGLVRRGVWVSQARMRNGGYASVSPVASAGRVMPYIATSTRRARSIAIDSALRTRTSSNGGFFVFA